MKDEEDPNESTAPCTGSHSSPPCLLQKSFSAALTFPSYIKTLHPGLIQAAQAPGSMAYPEGIFPSCTAVPHRLSTGQCQLGGSPPRALGPLLQGFSLKHQKQMDGALSSEFWVPVLCIPASEPLRHQASQVVPLPEACAPALEDPISISKLLVLTNPASHRYFPSPRGDSCLLQLTLRYLRVLFLPFQSANTSLAPSLVAQMVKSLPIVWETQEDPLEKEVATHSSILAWKIPGTEEPCRLQSMGSQTVEYN